MIYEIEGIPAISRVNPHVPTPCIIPPRPYPPCTRSHHRLNNFPNTVSIYMRAQTSSLPLLFPCVRTFYVRPCGATDAPIFSVTCFLSLSPPYLFIFPFVGRLPEFPSRDTVILYAFLLVTIASNLLFLSLYFFHKKNQSWSSTNLAQASSFVSLATSFLSFFSYPPFRRATTIVNFKPWWIYIYTKSIEFDFDRTHALKCIESRERIWIFHSRFRC